VDPQAVSAPVTFETKDLASMWLLNEEKQIDDAAAAQARWVSPTKRSTASSIRG
jgi:hypothetical protein